MNKGKLILVRHGLSVYNDQNRFTGWKDVELNQQGIDEAKQELEEIVEFLKDPQKFQRLGGKIPKGCLLVNLV